MSKGLQTRWIVLVLNEVTGIIEIDIIVRVAIDETLDIVAATQPYNPADHVGVAESKIDGVVSAKASPCSDQVRVGVMLDGERQDFVQEVVIVLHLSHCSLGGVPPPGIPAFGINAIYTDSLKPALLKMLR